MKRDDPGNLRELLNLAIAALEVHAADVTVVVERLPRTVLVRDLLCRQHDFAVDTINELARQRRSPEPDPEATAVLIREVVSIRQTTEALATHMMSRELAQVVGCELSRLQRGGVTKPTGARTVEASPTDRSVPDRAGASSQAPVGAIGSSLEGVRFLKARLAQARPPDTNTN